MLQLFKLLSFLIVFLTSSIASANELHQAARNGNYAEVVRLLDTGMDVNATDERGTTPLQNANPALHPQMLRWAREYGAGVLTEVAGVLPVVGVPEIVADYVLGMLQ